MVSNFQNQNQEYLIPIQDERTGAATVPFLVVILVTASDFAVIWHCFSFWVWPRKNQEEG